MSSTRTLTTSASYENGKLLRLPIIRKPKEAAVRQGFFEEEPYEAVRRHLPADLQVVVSIGYVYGWRIRSEVLPLRRDQVDLRAGTLSLHAGETNNDEGREVHLTDDLTAALAAQEERVRTLERRLTKATAGPVVVPLTRIEWLFPLLTGRRAGQQRHEMRKAWATACRKPGVAGMLKHDLRRTAVRGMVRAGIPERVAMQMTGHKTRAVFDRYHIVSPADLREAARKLDGHNLGTVTGAAVDARSLSL
jgi:integrase